MPVVSSWDWIGRRIYLGIADYDPIDIYREHRALRLTEVGRGFAPMVRMIGGQSKGGGRRFGNALQMISGASFSALPGLDMARIVPLDGSDVNVLGGEIVTDDPDTEPDPFDSSTLTDPPRIVTSPISEIIEASGGGSQVTTMACPDDVVAEVDTRNVIQAHVSNGEICVHLSTGTRVAEVSSETLVARCQQSIIAEVCPCH